MHNSPEHIPVLSDKLLEFIRLPDNAVMIDATVGNGGHSVLFAKRYPNLSRIIGFDVDNGSLERAKPALADCGCNFELIKENFCFIDKAAEKIGVKKADFILADLGWSSSQILDPEKGLSFGQNMPLDMRLDERLQVSAADIVNKSNEAELADIIYQFGEERASRRVARFIVEYRVKMPINTTGQLAAIVCKAIGKGVQKGQIHPATRTFQALRIAVNKELESLEMFLDAVQKILNPNGYLAVISFHSLEDRIVKENFKKNSSDGLYSLLTKKPVVADYDEIKQNPRARSAKLRIAQRV